MPVLLIALGNENYCMNRSYEQQYGIRVENFVPSEAIHQCFNGGEFPRGTHQDSEITRNQAAVVEELQGFLAHNDCLLLGPYSRALPRPLRWSLGGGHFLMTEVPLWGGNRLDRS